MSTDTDMPEPIREDVFDRIADILIVLSEVTSGLFSTRLPDLEKDDPLYALYYGINDMVDHLSNAQEQAKRYQRELEERLQTIEQQRTAIRDLSTPIIEVWRGVLCLPVVGILDTSRSADMTETLLRTVVQMKAKCAIVDVTGIDVMDTATANHFLHMARALRLLGARCYVTGIKPGIAQTLVHIGVDLRELHVHRTLRDALSEWVAEEARLRAVAKARPAQAI